MSIVATDRVKHGTSTVQVQIGAQVIHGDVKRPGIDHCCRCLEQVLTVNASASGPICIKRVIPITLTRVIAHKKDRSASKKRAPGVR